MSSSVNSNGIDKIATIIGEYLMIFVGILKWIGVRLYQESASKDCNLQISVLIPKARHLPTSHDHNNPEIVNKIRITKIVPILNRVNKQIQK